MIRLVALLLLTFATTACGGGGVKQRLFPPSASIQELAMQPDGSWKLKIRVQNFSNVAMTIARVEADMRISAAPAGKIVLTPNASVPPESAEVFDLDYKPMSPAANQVQNVVTKRFGGQLSYSLEGRIVSSEPDARDDEFEFKSQLATVPGLERTLR
jgi:hypothetical protein